MSLAHIKSSLAIPLAYATATTRANAFRAWVPFVSLFEAHALDSAHTLGLSTHASLGITPEVPPQAVVH